MNYQVLLFYKYVTIDEPEALRSTVLSLATKRGLKGRVLVAHEGINGTLEGETEQTEAFVAELFADPRLSDISVKRSRGTGASFAKLKVKVRNEIVGTQFGPEIDPRVETGKRISAEELKNWYENKKEFVIVDMRNDYEFASGHFKGSINPGLENSRDLPAAVDKLAPSKDATVLTVCTGGVRCEKMSAFLLKQGFQDVYQLEDGMHGYMEKFPGQDFLGTLYTFDNRLVMDFGGERLIIGECHRCTAKTETYVNCINNACHLHFLICDNCTTPDGAFCSDACEAIISAQK